MQGGSDLTYEDFARVVTTDADLLGVFCNSSLYSRIPESRIGKSLVKLSSTGSVGVLFYQLMKHEFSQGGSYIPLSGENFATFAIDSFVRLSCGPYIKRVLSSPVRLVIDAIEKDFEDFELNPTKFGVDMPVEEIEVVTEKNTSRLMNLVACFARAIFCKKGMEGIPVELKALGRYIQVMQQAYPENGRRNVAKMFIGRVISPAIVFPERCGIQRRKMDEEEEAEEISKGKRKVLATVAQIIENISVGRKFGVEDLHMEPLNQCVDEFSHFCQIFLKKLCLKDETLTKVHKKHMGVLSKNLAKSIVTNNDILKKECVVVYHLLKQNEDLIIEDLKKKQNNAAIKKVFMLLNGFPGRNIPAPHNIFKLEEIVSKDSDSGNKMTIGSVSDEFKPRSVSEAKRQQKYDEILARCAKLNFHEFDRLNLIRFHGKTREGYPICLIKEPMLAQGLSKVHHKADEVKLDEMDKLWHYMLQTLDNFTKSPYALVFCFNKSTIEKGYREFKRPKVKFYLKAYQSLPRRVRKNIKGLFIVHSPRYIAVVLGFLRSVVSGKFWKKFKVIQNIDDLADSIDLDIEMKLPPDVFSHHIKTVLKSATPKFPLYQVELSEVMNRSHNKGRTVPVFVEEYIKYISTKSKMEGIFRKAGNTKVITQMKEIINHGYSSDLVHVDFHGVCGALKLWFREMKTPLLTYEYYDDFLRILTKDDDLMKPLAVDKVRKLLRNIPDCHYEVAKYLFRFLFDVSKDQKKNKMGPSNLAIVFGPNVLKSIQGGAMNLLRDNNFIGRITEYLIRFAENIFPGNVSPTKKGKKTKSLQPVRRTRRTRQSHRSEHVNMSDLKILEFAFDN